jgi:predicted metal-dependent peptidase
MAKTLIPKPTAADSDPFADVENAAKRQRATAQATKAIDTARVQLVLDKDPNTYARSVFFATLACRLKAKAVWHLPTMATDGKHLFYNPDFTNTLTREQCTAVVAHEVMHNALCHMARIGHRDHFKFNVAADLAINPLLTEAGFKLPPDCCVPGVKPFEKLPVGLSAEEYYNLLDDQMMAAFGGDGSDPGGCGQVLPAGDGSQAAASEAQADWKVAVDMAHSAARQKGNLPAGIDRMVEAVLDPKVDWRSVLREFVRSHAKNDWSWTPPNRRYVWQSLYMPGMHSEEMDDVVLAIDTSGSIGQAELDRFAAECQGVMEAYGCTVHIIYCDAAVHRVETWTPQDGNLKLHPVGGGGTSHEPLWEYLAGRGTKDLPPPPRDVSCVVALTDMATDFGEDPGVPVLWAAVGTDAEAPFGRTIRVE